MINFFSITFKTAIGLILPLYAISTSGSFSMDRQPGRETDHSLPSSTKIKNLFGALPPYSGFKNVLSIACGIQHQMTRWLCMMNNKGCGIKCSLFILNYPKICLETIKNTKKDFSQPISGLRFKLGISSIWIKDATHHTVTFNISYKPSLTWKLKAYAQPQSVRLFSCLYIYNWLRHHNKELYLNLGSSTANPVTMND